MGLLTVPLGVEMDLKPTSKNVMMEIHSMGMVARQHARFKKHGAVHLTPVTHAAPSRVLN